MFLLFLPPILFGAGYFTSIRDFKANLRAIGLLSVGLVLSTIVVVAVVAHTLIPGLGWAAAFALGAIVAPPDAVAATAIFQRLGVPRRIVTILEGESLVNDATALVAYRVRDRRGGDRRVLAGRSGRRSFVLVAVGGVVVGLLVGMAVAWLLRADRRPGVLGRDHVPRRRSRPTCRPRVLGRLGRARDGRRRDLRRPPRAALA